MVAKKKIIKKKVVGKKAAPKPKRAPLAPNDSPKTEGPDGFEVSTIHTFGGQLIKTGQDQKGNVVVQLKAHRADALAALAAYELQDLRLKITLEADVDHDEDLGDWEDIFNG